MFSKIFFDEKEDELLYKLFDSLWEKYDDRKEDNRAINLHLKIKTISKMAFYTLDITGFSLQVNINADYRT
tara:strand:+ start:168 stop:380 length:213 start_codon:yes stop_codon:yes gene_type:complete